MALLFPLFTLSVGREIITTSGGNMGAIFDLSVAMATKENNIKIIHISTF